MADLNTAPSAADIILFSDPLAGVLKTAHVSLGIAAPGESGTIAVSGDSARTKIMGDGTTTNPGLGHPYWQSQIGGMLDSLAASQRWDIKYKADAASLVSILDGLVQKYLPRGWSFPASASQAHIFDFWLTRLNANAAGVPTTPSAAGTLTAITDALGAIPNVLVGSAPRVVHTLVGAADYLESLPSAQATQVALSGSQNAYSYQIAGTVPAGVTKVRTYRGYIAGGAGIWFWDQDVAVTAGSAYPAIKILCSDAQLRADIAPPSWLSCQVTHEFAALFALAYATQVGTSVQYASNAMLSPSNVVLGPSNGFVGFNPASSMTFGTSAITGLNTQTYTAGTIQTANNSLSNVQGFSGGTQIRARATSTLNAAGTVTVSYTYVDAANPQTPQSATGLVSSAFSGTAVGSVATFTVPAGRLVKTVTVTGVAGGMSSGGFTTEADYTRAF